MYALYADYNLRARRNEMLKGKLLDKLATTASQNVATTGLRIIGWCTVNSAKNGKYIRFNLSDGSYRDRVLASTLEQMKTIAPNIKYEDLSSYPLPTPIVVKW
jgi:hypothetical protein